jgi:hypothetical protein
METLMKQMAGQEVMITLGDLVGRLEIAERYGVRRNTIDLWSDRGVLPPPAPPMGRYISGNPVYVQSYVDEVLLATGRKIVNPDPSKLVGRLGLADVLRVSDEQIAAWEADGTLPKPEMERVAGHPLWKRNIIADLEKVTGRPAKRNRAE